MSNISYIPFEDRLRVELDRKYVGDIKPILCYTNSPTLPFVKFKYFPKGKVWGGRSYKTIEAVKNSLEQE